VVRIKWCGQKKAINDGFFICNSDLSYSALS